MLGGVVSGGSRLNGTGKAGSGKRRVRVEDVAREAGVSPITVSRALSTPEKVREETRKLVTDAVAKTGYVVNSIASTLRSGHSSIIAVFAANLRNQHFADVVQGCSDALEGSGFHVLMSQSGTSEAQRREAIESVIPFRPAAMLFTDLSKLQAVSEMVGAEDIPVMEMWDQRGDPDDMLVTVSEHDAGRLMGHHFARQGYRRIAYAGLLYDRGRRRVEGFREALAEHGASCDLVVPVAPGIEVADGIAALGTILEKMPDCEAVFFGNDSLAAGGLVYARRHDLQIPGDLAIAGFGDLGFARHMEPPLTSLLVDSYGMGLTAGKMLLRRLRGQQVAEKIVAFPVQLQERRSTLRSA